MTILLTSSLERIGGAWVNFKGKAANPKPDKIDWQYKAKARMTKPSKRRTTDNGTNPAFRILQNKERAFDLIIANIF